MTIRTTLMLAAFIWLLCIGAWLIKAQDPPALPPIPTWYCSTVNSGETKICFLTAQIMAVSPDERVVYLVSGNQFKLGINDYLWLHDHMRWMDF